MAKILVSVQADQFTDDQIKRLEAVLRRNYAEHVTDTKVTVIWCVVPQGQFYTNYKLSRSSLISMLRVSTRHKNTPKLGYERHAS